MKILIAPDKFKGSLNAQQVCDAVANGIYEKHPSWAVVKCPMADGGEGTAEILTAISGGSLVRCLVRDPLFREIESEYGLSADGKTAFIEMAGASGLQLLKKHERNPMRTSTVGAGDLIAHALSKGVDSIVLGCGGSATNDGGIGMASSLGVRFLDEDGNEIKPIGENLSKILSINSDRIHSEISRCKFILLSDVNNPLLGTNGASFIYGKQKGATDLDIIQLDEGLKNFSAVLNNSVFTDFPGAGAAGGFPVSAKAFLNAEIRSGIQYILDSYSIDEKIKEADLVITGEGKLDQQSLQGKVVVGISKLCRFYQKPLWAICGISEVNDSELQQLEIEKVIPLVRNESDKEKAIDKAADWIKDRIIESL
jgi:glycerate kinase